MFIDETIQNIMRSTQQVIAAPAKQVREVLLDVQGEVRKTMSAGAYGGNIPIQTPIQQATMLFRETTDVGKELNSAAVKAAADVYVAGRRVAKTPEALAEGFLTTSQMAIGMVQAPFKALAAGVSEGSNAVRKTGEDFKETVNSVENIAWIIGGVAVIGIAAYVFMKNKKK